MSDLLSAEEALTRVLALMTPTGTESVPLAEASGRVLASPIYAERDQPPFAASAMDGYAVRAADAAEGALGQAGEPRVLGRGPGGVGLVVVVVAPAVLDLLHPVELVGPDVQVPVRIWPSMSSVKVALNSSVCRYSLNGVSRIRRFTSGIKPMSSMRSASSITNISTSLKNRSLFFTKSIKRPGVPTTMSIISLCKRRC